MAHETNGKSLNTVVAFAALALSAFCTAYILNYLPNLEGSSTYYEEEFQRLYTQLDNQRDVIAGLQTSVEELQSKDSNTAEKIALNQAVATLMSLRGDSVANRNGEIGEIVEELQQMLDTLEGEEFIQPVMKRLPGEPAPTLAPTAAPSPTPEPEPTTSLESEPSPESETEAAADPYTNEAAVE